MSGAGRPTCPSCREAYIANHFLNPTNPKTPPCDKCYPNIHPRNKMVFDVWELCQGQWRYSFNGAMCLDLLAVNAALDMFDVPFIDRKTIAKQVILVGDIILSSAKKDQKDKDDIITN